MAEDNKGKKEEKNKKKDIRRYYCEYCGICRSKKSLIASHVLTHHQEEMTYEDEFGEEETMEQHASNTCEECGASFKKPAYLKQHMLGHSLERPYRCSVDDCHCSYRRKDHLKRHLLQHERKLFACPVESCGIKFAFRGNIQKHVDKFHGKESPAVDVKGQKQHACKEPGCQKTFKYQSQLQKHEDSHVKLDSVEGVCLDPGCMKHFTNSECLKAHIRSCHQYIKCEICGAKQLRKNIKRHLRTHEAPLTTDRIKCQYKNCSHSFSTKTNLTQHVKAVHFKIKRFACGFPGCGKRFTYKHVRDNHEKSGCHVRSTGDFMESDERLRSRPRGGRKRKFPTIENLIRKRVTPSTEFDERQAWFAVDAESS